MVIAFIGLFSSFWFYKCNCYHCCVQKKKKTPSDKECLQREIKMLYVIMHPDTYYPLPLHSHFVAALSLLHTHTHTHTHTHNKTKKHTGWTDYNACTSPQHDVQIVQVPTDAWGVLPEPPAGCVGGGARRQTYEAAHPRDLGDPGVPQRQQGPDLAGLAGWASVVHCSAWCLNYHSLQHVLNLMPLRRFVRASKLLVQWRVEDQVYGF